MSTEAALTVTYVLGALIAAVLGFVAGFLFGRVRDVDAPDLLSDVHEADAKRAALRALRR